MNKLGIAILAGAMTLAAVFPAHAQKTQRIRGTITALDGDVLSIKTREGRDITVELTAKSSVAAARAIALGDMKQGEYVGVTTRAGAEGSLLAMEVHVIPRTVREGHIAWDLAPGTMMTNANIESVVQSAGGQELVVKYKDGSKKILVPPGTPIVTTTPADRSYLKPGEYVFMGVNVGEDGKLSSSSRIQVSRDGVKPPQ